MWEAEREPRELCGHSKEPDVLGGRSAVAGVVNCRGTRATLCAVSLCLYGGVSVAPKWLRRGLDGVTSLTSRMHALWL